MENENKVESNVEVIDAKEQKPKKNILGKIIGWLIVLAIFCGLGYLIYQNGGIPEDGFDIGEIIGYNCPDDMYLAIDGCTIGADGTSIVPSEKNEEKKLPEIPEDFLAVRNLKKIDDYAGQRLSLGYGLLYSVDRPEYNQHYNDGGLEYLTALTGLNDFSYLISASYNDNATPNLTGPYIEVFLELWPEVDAISVAETIKNSIIPSEINVGSEDFNQMFDSLSIDDVYVSVRDNYIYIVIIGPDMIGSNKSITPEKLIETFEKITLE